MDLKKELVGSKLWFANDGVVVECKYLGQIQHREHVAQGCDGRLYRVWEFQCHAEESAAIRAAIGSLERIKNSDLRRHQEYEEKLAKLRESLPVDASAFPTPVQDIQPVEAVA